MTWCILITKMLISGLHAPHIVFVKNVFGLFFQAYSSRLLFPANIIQGYFWDENFPRLQKNACVQWASGSLMAGCGERSHLLVTVHGKQSIRVREAPTALGSTSPRGKTHFHSLLIRRRRYEIHTQQGFWLGNAQLMRCVTVRSLRSVTAWQVEIWTLSDGKTQTHARFVCEIRHEAPLPELTFCNRSHSRDNNI